MAAFRNVFNLEFVVRGNEKNRGQDLNSRFCLLSHLWIFDWTKVKDPKHSTPYCIFLPSHLSGSNQALWNFSKSCTFRANVGTTERQTCKKTFSQKTFQFPWPCFSDIIKITQSPPAICFTITPPQEYFEIVEIFLFQ